MRVLVVNLILYTPEKGVIPKVKSIKDTMIYNMCLGLKANGHEVVLYSVEDYKPVEEEEYGFDIVWDKSILPQLFKPSLIPYPSSLQAFIRNSQFDLIISSEILSVASIIVSLNHPSRKSIYWCELSEHVRFAKGIASRIYYNLVGRSIFANSHLVCRSQEAKEFHSKFCSNIDNVIIEHGINLERFKLQPKKNQCIIVAQLIARKNVKRIIERFIDFVNNTGVNYTLKIAGDGELREELQQFVDDSGFKENVFFLGKIPHSELSLEIAESKAMLVDTLRDLNMVSIPEAIASGTPVLMNSVPSSKSYIAKHNLGLVKDNWSWEDINSIVSSAKYIENCLKYRDTLSIKYLSKKMVQTVYTDESTTCK